jgi:putative tricarboxylic transport membrane protein
MARQGGPARLQAFSSLRRRPSRVREDSRRVRRDRGPTVIRDAVNWRQNRASPRTPPPIPARRGEIPRLVSIHFQERCAMTPERPGFQAACIAVRRTLLALAAGLASASSAMAAPWEPTKPVELVVPAGPGGGADQMARFIQAAVAKNKLMRQPILVVNKAGGAGAEGFLDVKADAGNPHKIVITLSNLFTTPLAHVVPFNWRDLTPVSMLALDQFVLWVPNDWPYKTAKEYVDDIRSREDLTFKMGGTGSKQEDEIITVMMQKVVGKKIAYEAYRGGGEVATQLVNKYVDSTVNNPIEAESHWRAGKVRPLCVMDSKRMPYPQKVTDRYAWSDIPTCTSAGVPVDYVMLRGIFLPPAVSPEQLAFYVDLFNKVRALPEWKEFMAKGAFNQTTMSGQAFFDWLARNEHLHRVLMKEAGFLAH